MQNDTHNITNYMRYRFFYGMLIIGPVLTPYFRWKGLDYTEIMLLQSIAAASVVLFEVPTGALADKLSRRLSLVLAGSCIGVALIIYIQFHAFFAFATAEILFGLGMTFGSGADSALLYESLNRLNRKDDYAQIEGRTASFVFVGQGIGAVASSLLYTINPDLPFWISVLSAFTAAGFALRFTETERAKSVHTYHMHVLKSLNTVARTPRILWAVCLAALMGVAARSGFWLYEPYFTRVQIDVAWFGFIFLFFNIIAALSAKYLVNRLPKPRRVLLGLGVLMAISFLIPTVLVIRWSVVLIGLQQIVRGVYRPTLGAYLNRQIDDDSHRATVLSVVSVAASLSFACVSPLVGLSLDHYGAVSTYAAMGSCTLLGVVLLARFRRAQIAREPIQTPQSEASIIHL